MGAPSRARLALELQSVVQRLRYARYGSELAVGSCDDLKRGTAQLLVHSQAKCKLRAQRVSAALRPRPLLSERRGACWWG